MMGTDMTRYQAVAGIPERETDASMPERVLPRAEGCVLWLYPQGWEDGELIAARPPMPFDDFAALLRERGWTVHWTALGVLEEGLYRGGVVVLIDVDDRAYVAVPPDLVDRLSEVMSAQDYQLVCEDVAALANPGALGVQVSRLDVTAWEQRRALVVQGELPAERWAETIREKGLRLEPLAEALLSLESVWPAGRVVRVMDAGGRSFYFAVPRAALRLLSAMVRAQSML